VKLYSSSYKWALVAAFVLPVLGSAVLVFYVDWYWALLHYVVLFALSYILFRVILDRFIYSKIRVIYKIIHRFKTEGVNRKQFDDPLSEVSSEVFNWAKERRDEIAELKRQETFRREFIGNLSHELKTPLFQLQGYIHTLLDGALQDEKVNERFLQRTAKSADRMVELVNDLNDISQLESGEVELNYKDFDLRKLIQDVYEEMEYQAKQSEVKLDWKKGDFQTAKVHADKKRIKQVLINLVTNGIKYSAVKGTVKCGLYDLDGRVLVEVSDDGLGIAENELPRLFERFYRVEKSRNRDEGGSGLGLSIVKHILVAHNQSINVRSTEGKGSTFSFTLEKAGS
jgi:two-component system phosphate regulon sensor histidine kinase PhoR